jgi:two-component system, LytTR family, response regulator AlgR
MTLKVLIVDDESLARLRLRGLVEATVEPRAEVVGEAADAAGAILLLESTAVDVLLLDIRMPGRSGLQLADALRRRSSPPAVVFVTAHAGHALAAFELEATDYLTKPVRRERLQAALQRVAQRRAPPLPAAAVVAGPVLVVSDRGRVQRVPVAELLYLKAELKYVTLRTATASYLLDDALADLEQRLGDAVVRIHRNALVARHAVRALEKRTPTATDDGAAADGWAVKIAATDEWLSVSRRQLAAVRDALLDAGR